MTADARLVERRHRTAAAVLVAVVATTVAASAHALAGGGVPSVAAVGLALMLSVAIGMVAIGPRLTRTRTAIGVVTDQVVFHSVFAFFGPASVMVTHDAAHPHAHAATSLVGVVLPSAGAAPVAVMVASHLGAALVAYGMLRSGIRAIESVLRAVTRAVTRALRLPDGTTLPALPRAIATSLVAPLRSAQLRLPEGRGPPMLAVA